MTNLSDTQRILLSTASGREGGSILPLPACLKPGGGTAKAIAALMKRGLIDERETRDAGAARREEGNVRLGAFITAAGLAAIGVEADSAGGGESAAPSPVPAAKTSKTAAVLDLLRRPEGATLPELIEATGWLPHTTRAALTNLRKKGHVLDRSKRDDVTCYCLVSGS